MSSPDRAIDQFHNDDYFVLRVVEPPGPPDPLYPNTSSDGSQVVFTYEDGPPGNAPVFVARSLAIIDPIRSTSRSVMSFDDINAQVLVTQHRTVMFCPEYAKAGIPSPGLISIISWLVKRQQIRSRTQGTVLVGHVQHDRVTALSASGNEVLITTSSPLSPRPLLVQVEFRTKFDADAAYQAMVANGARPSPPGDE